MTRRCWAWIVGLVVVVAGCTEPRPLTFRWPWHKEKNPQPPEPQPRRLAALEPIILDDDQGVVQPAAGEDETKRREVVSTVVARVNGEPILAEDLLAPLRSRLAQARQSLTEAEYVALRDRLLREQLESLIERQLLVQAARRTFPEPVVKRIEAFADQEFEKQLKAEAERLGFATVEELKQHLRRQGQSIEQMRQVHRDTILAQQFVRAHVGSKVEVTRREMLEYYETHRDRFEESPAVRWREILVSIERHGSREAARAHAEKLVQQLRAGADFAELAKRESDGATAGDGGLWPWTPPGSYIVDAVDKVLFQLPPGQISDPIPGPQGFHIVRVEERREGGVKPFEEVQEEIREELRQQKIERAVKRLLEKLRREAYIVTVFDEAEAVSR